ncbi:MAG: hypothetical protein RB191_21365 [Terriglobia bacterium]|nr:hypothetical protein [Terriglobia bacterium]
MGKEKSESALDQRSALRTKGKNLVKVPITFNRSVLPARLRRLVPNNVDPRTILEATASDMNFREAVGAFLVGGTFKTTASQRYPATLSALLELRFRDRPVVLDVGVSDGSAALATLEVLPYARYYLTDKYFDIVAQRSHNGVLFSDLSGNPIVYADDWFISYAETKGAIWPLSKFSTWMIKRALKERHGPEKTVRLLSPSLQSIEDPSLVVKSYDVFEKWPLEQIDLVIAANLFNRGYFSDTLIKRGLENIRNAMRCDGVLAVVENRKHEQATLFRLQNGRFLNEKRVGPGCDIEGLVEAL